MLQPFLFIGLGGSGGKTLRVVRDDLRRRLEEIGWQRQQPLPSLWQFVHIDVPPNPDGVDPDIPSEWPQRSYLGLVSPKINYATMDNALMTKAAGKPELLAALSGWRPRPEEATNVPVQKGAGQYRAIGRLITVSHLGQIKAAIAERVRELKRPEIIAQGSELAEKFGFDAKGEVEPTVVVTASLAGGAGAGALLDVFDVLHGLAAHGEGQWLTNAFCLLYSPEVFGAVPANMRAGVNANALATLSELIGAVWNNEPAGPEELAVLREAGLGAPPSKRGPAFTFVVGAANSKVALTDQNAIYRAAGKIVAAWATTPILQEQIGQYALANMHQSSLDDGLGLKEETLPQPLSAIGFARLSLGREQFLAYSEERLARAAFERLCQWQNAESPEVDKAVTERLDRFLRDTGLGERAVAQNRVIEEMRPRGLEERVRAFIQEVEKQVRKNVVGSQPIDWWRQAIGSFLEQRGELFLDEERKLLHQSARAWVRALPGRLAKSLSEVIAERGLTAAEQLVKAAIEHLNGTVAALGTEKEQYRAAAQRVGEQVGKVFGSHPVSAIGADHRAIQDSIKEGVKCFEWAAEADLRDIAQRLLRDAVGGTLEPARAALREARKAALDVYEDQDAPFHYWPKGQDLPKRFLPGPTEVMLVRAEEFPQTFDRLVELTFGAARDTARNLAVVEALAGTKEESQDAWLVQVQRDWVPSEVELLGLPDAGAEVARFRVTWQLDALLDRMRRWCRRQGSHMRLFIEESLDEYLAEDHCDEATRQARLNDFRAALKSLLAAAEPLVRIDEATAAKILSQPLPPPRPIFSPLPFAADSEGRRRVEDAIREAGMWHDDVAKAFTEARCTRIDVVTMLGAMVPASVFGSLTDPMLADWAAHKSTPESRARFWRWRRARPLVHALPVSPAVLRAMVRGWFVAQLLGRLKVDDTGDGDLRAEIFVGGAEGWCGFPYPLLRGEVFHQYDELPAVLESLPVALIEHAGGGAPGAQAMRAYGALRDLGRDGQRDWLRYRTPARPLVDWLREGKVGAGAPGPTVEIGDDGSASTRVAEAEAFFRKRLESYRRLFDEQKPVSAEAIKLVPRAWELRVPILDGLEALTFAVRAIAPDDPETAF
jgi:hypothetical protein